MKFGKSFEKALEDEDLPEEWKAAAIKYKSLKVVLELESLGLTAETIKNLLESTADESGLAQSPTATIEYRFDGTTRSIQPRICFTVDTSTPQIEELSATTREALRDLLQKANTSESPPDSPRLKLYDPVANADLEERLESMHLAQHQKESSSPRRSATVQIASNHEGEIDGHETGGVQTIQIKLDSDLEFFDMLSGEVDKLDTLQSREKSMVLANVNQLGIQVSNLVRPNNKGKQNPDMVAWRQILRLYEDAGIFRPSSELQRKSHTPEKAATQLDWFMDQVSKANILPETSKNLKSRSLYNTFHALNLAMLQQVKFHSMNQQAMGKILKKFDKRTALTAKSTFPEFMASDPFFNNGLAQAMYYALASNIMAVVPQLDDFECPVCTSITIKPVRLSCSHVFCVRCLIRLQLARENHCPICRRDNVLAADSTNIDWALLNFLKMYFPKEAREKQRDNEREQLRQNPWLRR
ncbi:RING-14 protein [Taphrina deformans PYCC 5710]|uniref:RING-14 protein n=1 Tax=Taphrina deformans (strain PYCC 5710 / ATCC 11124 / CBS 356.35 / IMI 108563 / JCM 9778 / NBRC 8474) TaxID=1097556 RepID=R4X7F3_TAPDE|nr:RING-14 protein [Taphrina deformans PYCC 5710]|eukprot:CCG81305.1 RING-14 protein [Taphrina deformans PYCC 5710]